MKQKKKSGNKREENEERRMSSSLNAPALCSAPALLGVPPSHSAHARAISPPAVESTRFSGGSKYPADEILKLIVTLIWSLRCEVNVTEAAVAELIVQLPPKVTAPTGSTDGDTAIEGHSGLHTDARRV